MDNNIYMEDGKTVMFLRKTESEVKVYNKCKYERDSKIIKIIDYITEGFTILNKLDFTEREFEDMEKRGMVDEEDEYLKLWLTNNKTILFRSSHVDVFTK